MVTSSIINITIGRLIAFIFKVQKKSPFHKSELAIKKFYSLKSVNVAWYPGLAQSYWKVFAYLAFVIVELDNIDFCFGIKILHKPFQLSLVYYQQILVLKQDLSPLMLLL